MEELIIFTRTQFEQGLKDLENNLLIAIKEAKGAELPSKEWLTIKDVCDLLNISAQTVHDWSDMGILVKYKIGRAVRFKSSELNEALVRSETKRRRVYKKTQNFN